MSEGDRYKHLEHIRKQIYENKTEVSYTHKYTKEFIDALKTLRCIGPDGSILKSISSFCDHRVSTFTFFSSEYPSLPEQLQTNDWLNFFKKLGLRDKFEQKDFLDLCNKVSAREVEHVGSYSAALLEYIFSEEAWFNDKPFLEQVSNIAFVPTADSSSVNWIAPCVCPDGQLVKLNGAASQALMKLVWTVRPIVQLPQTCLSVRSVRTSTMLANMNIFSEADACDVISNMKNISQSSYSESKLFNNYPSNLLPSEEASLLLDTIDVNLRFLNPTAQNPLVKSLMEVPCIPVYCDLLEQEKKKMVLVEPTCILMNSDTSTIKDYHPFLHHLPMKLMNLTPILQEIGVKNTMELCHLQIVLQKIFREKRPIDPTAKQYVKRVLHLLYKRLRGEDDNGYNKADSLTPLYLPDVNDELKLSTTMLYGDTPCYFGHMKLDLSGTPYSYFDITKKSYGIDAVKFCHVLPEKIKPLKMSVVCKQLISEDCKPTDHSELSGSIEKSVQFESNPSVIAEVFNKFLFDEIDEENLRDILSKFFTSWKVVAVKNLKTQLLIKESKKIIGDLKVNFFIETSESESILYIDHSFSDKGEIVGEITERLYSTVSRCIPNAPSWEENSEMFKVIMKYLKASTTARKESILSQFQIGAKAQPTVKLTFELGEEIPEGYCQWLDHDPYNTFSPMELVGYEDREGHIIFAQIVHLVKNEESNHLCGVYYILTSKDDSEGREASVLDLYKFLVADTKVPLSADKEDEVKPLHEGDVAEMKEKIRKRLGEIWKLDQDLRRKAVKRLYLEWHPERNLGNQERAEVFKYLKQQILKKQEQPVSDPKSNDNLPQQKAYSSASFSYEKYDHIARSHSVAFEQMHPESGANASSPFAEIKGNMGNPKEGNRWMKQAEVDFNILCRIHSIASTTNDVYAHVCFMAHQVAEKALKGGLYSLCDVNTKGLTDTNLTRLAYVMETAHSDKTIAQHAQSLDDYYSKTRYPNCWPNDADMPSDHYTEADADKAKKDCEAILNIVKSVMPQL